LRCAETGGKSSVPYSFKKRTYESIIFVPFINFKIKIYEIRVIKIKNI